VARMPTLHDLDDPLHQIHIVTIQQSDSLGGVVRRYKRFDFIHDSNSEWAPTYEIDNRYDSTYLIGPRLCTNSGPRQAQS
jgi:hypothetical protein